ncbi:MAG: hypothetical protein ACAH59_12410 [Pseudobdellovibrionaceae bacterium]
MKKIFLTLFCIQIISSAKAEMAVQRTLDSSYRDYANYLESSGRTSFVAAYIQLSSVTELETPLLEKCLEEVYLGAPSQITCLSAVKSLTAKPLNKPRREVLYSFLVKLEKSRSQHQTLYRDLRLGLLRTHFHLAKTFDVPVPAKEEDQARVAALEMKAWKKAVQKRFPLEEIALLINGKKVAKLESWTAPQGIYQWSLITNTHEPITRIGSFSQFAAESLKDLKPLAPGNCQSLLDLEAQKFGLLQLEIYSNKKCVARFGMNSTVGSSEHLGKSSQMVKMEKSSSRHWIWPVVAIIGVGLATSLNGKQVSLQMPGAH